MTLQEIFDESRSDLADTELPYLWTDLDLIRYVNRVVNIMCEKAYLISDSTTAQYCVQNLVFGQQAYLKDPKVIQVRWARLDGMTIPMERKTLNWLESHFPSWQIVEPAFPRYFSEDIEKQKVVYIPSPDQAYTSRMIVYRYPVAPLSLSSMNASPEFEERYHKYIKMGVLWQAYMKDDPEAYDPKRSTEYKILFDKDVARVALDIQKTWFASTTVGVHKAFI